MISIADFEYCVWPKFIEYKQAKKRWCDGNDAEMPEEVISTEKNLAWIMNVLLDERNKLVDKAIEIR